MKNPYELFPPTCRCTRCKYIGPSTKFYSHSIINGDPLCYICGDTDNLDRTQEDKADQCCREGLENMKDAEKEAGIERDYYGEYWN